MIKNQLYPYIEKYINEYLFGFTKEQLNIGVMNGQIQLDNLIIRPDMTNEKFNELELPIWLKAGMIKKIYIGCSLMNFLGEKPLDINIDDIDMIVSPSFKWINRNMNTFIVELEHHMKEAYDPTDNNSSDIFQRKINFIDSTLYSKLKKPFIKLFQDNTFFSNLLSKIYTKVVRFFYKKSYLIKMTIKNINIRLEDDKFNFYGNNVFVLKVKMFEINLSVDGVNKKDNFKVEGIDLLWEGSNPKILLPSKLLNDNLDMENKIKDEKYYEIVRKLNLKTNTNTNNIFNILENFNFCGNFGISIVDSKNIDFFSKAVEKNYNFYLQVATSEINLTLYPELLQILENFIEIVKSYFIVEQIQDFKPMRRPYEKSNKIVQKLNDYQKFKLKRRMVVRDWFYYMIWFVRVKKALYANYFKNVIHEEFSKYFSVAFVNQSSEQIMNNAISESKQENLNPENVNFNMSIEILVKAITLNLMKSQLEKSKSQQEEYIYLKIQGLENRLYLKNRQNAEYIFNYKSLVISSSHQIAIDKNFEENINKSLKFKSKQGSTECQILSTVPNEKHKGSHQRNNLDFNQETGSDDSQEIFSEDKQKENKNVNNKLLLLNDILSNIESKNIPPAKKQNDSKSEISAFTSQTNTSCRSFLKVFIKNDHFTDEKTLQKTKKLKNQEFSNKILEFNKDLMKNVPIKIENKNDIKKVISINGISANSNQNNERIKMNLFEITSSSSEPSVKFNIKKEVFQGKASEKISLQFGNVRFNIIPSIANSCLDILIPYNKVFAKIFNLKGIKDKLKIEDKLHINEMRKYAINKLRDVNFTETKEYLDFLRALVEPYNSFSSKNFAIDYSFSLFMNNNYEISVNYNDLFILGVDYTPKHNSINSKEIVIDSSTATDYCKIRFPDIDLNIKLTDTSIYSKLFDVELKYSNLENWKTFITTMSSIINSQFSTQMVLLNPIMKRVIRENKQSSFNEENEIKNIINSNLRSMKVENNKGESSDTEELKSMSDD